MRQSLPIFTIFLILLSFTGCRSKKELELHHPGETAVWRNLKSEAQMAEAEMRPRVEIETSMGSFVIELFDKSAPISVANFIQYVNDGFYEDTVFHRVVPGMVVQGGGFTTGMERKETRDSIKNEAGNGLRNMRGTVGVARTSELDSGTSQFFINLVDNPSFNGDGINDGYAVFGRVYDGMDVVDSIAIVDTSVGSGGMSDVPVEPVILESARQIQ